MSREIAPITKDAETGEETHPSWGLVGVSHMSIGPTGAALFDSEILHRNTVRVTLRQARRHRDLRHDWIGADGRAPIVEIELSEAQWASFVSSGGQGDGVPCTIRYRVDREGHVPEAPHDPRLAESIDEVRGAADEAFEKVQEAFDAYDAHRTAANRRSLAAAIRNAGPNVEHASKSLVEHAETVVEKARVDVEAMVAAAAEARELDPGEVSTPQLEEARSRAEEERAADERPGL